MNVGGIPLMVTARINHCNYPIDVTFLVRSVSSSTSTGIEDNDQSTYNDKPMVERVFRGSKYENYTKYKQAQQAKVVTFDPNIDWEYTFVTTNQPESREIRGFYTSSNDKHIFCLNEKNYIL